MGTIHRRGCPPDILDLGTEKKGQVGSGKKSHEFTLVIQTARNAKSTLIIDSKFDHHQWNRFSGLE